MTSSADACDHEAGICWGKPLPTPEQVKAITERRHAEAGCAHAIGVCNARPWQQTSLIAPEVQPGRVCLRQRET